MLVKGLNIFSKADTLQHTHIFIRATKMRWCCGKQQYNKTLGQTHVRVVNMIF